MQPSSAPHPKQRVPWRVVLPALAITVASVLLHFTFARQGGGLWRDESGAASIALLPSLGDLWHALAHEPCPVVFPAALRAWAALGLGNDDAGLRLFGFLVGVSLLGAVWLNARCLTRSAPLLALGLLATNVTLIRWGDSLRAYGSGSVLMLLTLALVWCFLRTPTLLRWLAAATAAVLAVQCLFQNAYLILAVCSAAAVTAFARRAPRTAGLCLALGLPAAASLLLYLPHIQRTRDWLMLSQSGFQAGLIRANLSECVAGGDVAAWTRPFWLVLLAVILLRLGWLGLRAVRRTLSEKEAPEFFAATTLVLGGASFFVYLHMSAMPTQVWYFIPLLTLAAVCVDASTARWLPKLPLWRGTVALAIVVLSFPAALAQCSWRQTNMDKVADELAQQAKPEDLVLLNPWYLGVSFSHHYRGSAPWSSVPAIEDHRYHRYDLIKKRMQETDPLSDLRERIDATLRAGHRVWLVGYFPDRPTPPAPINPAPNNPWGWQDGGYVLAWSDQIAHHLHLHAKTREVSLAPLAEAVTPFENFPLLCASGWRE